MTRTRSGLGALSCIVCLVAAGFGLTTRASDAPPSMPGSYALDLQTVRTHVQAATQGQIAAGELPEKCMVPHLAMLDAAGIEIAARAPALADTSWFDTPGGKFRIAYYTTGRDSVPYFDDDESGVPDYVEWTGEAFDQCWTHEIDEMGFPPVTLLAGQRYRVTLKNTGGYYGWTNFSGVTTPGGSNIVLHCDFEGFYRTFPYLQNDDPDGRVRGAIRVTAAHEFKHALQISSGWNLSESIYWVELDATWMEDEVFDQVNDYYNYLTQNGSPFISPTTSLLSASYEDATWEHYLHERWGLDVLLEFNAVRHETPTLPGQNAYHQAAENLGIDWRTLWRDYALWNYLSGTRAHEGMGFGEAANYPTAATTNVASVPFEVPASSVPVWANRFYQIDNSQDMVSGGIRVEFEGNAAVDWGVTLVMQNPTSTLTFPLSVADGGDTLVVNQVDPATFDTIGVVIGDGRLAAAPLPGDTYRLKITSAPAVPESVQTFGAFKSFYRSKQ